jgi:hypothetical protein
MDQLDGHQNDFSHFELDAFSGQGDSHGSDHSLHSESIAPIGQGFSTPAPSPAPYGLAHGFEDTPSFGGLHDFTFDTTLTNLFEQPLSTQISALEQLIPLVKDYMVQHGQGEHLLNTLDETFSHIQLEATDSQAQGMVQDALHEAYDILGPTLFTEGTNSIGFS